MVDGVSRLSSQFVCGLRHHCQPHAFSEASGYLVNVATREVVGKVSGYGVIDLIRGVVIYGLDLCS